MSWWLSYLLVTAAAVPMAPEPWRERARTAIAHFVHDDHEVARLVALIASRATQIQTKLEHDGTAVGIDTVFATNVVQSLEAKAVLDERGPPLPMTARDIERTVIDYEGFKLDTWVTAGVFPKRFFGYFDDKYDTIPYERALRRVTHTAVEAVNAYEVARNGPLRITDIEVAITFLAEGGAWFLGERQDLLGRLHPVLDVGLDDLASGLAGLPGLAEQLDRALETRLAGLVAWTAPGSIDLPMPTTVLAGRHWLKSDKGEKGPLPYLTRAITFEEAIAATALLYLWEKELAARIMIERKHGRLERLTLDEQFIVGSLVYNSGKLHSPTRWKMIRTFTTGSWLAGMSESYAERRGRLPVMTPKLAIDWLASAHGYPAQPTSWLAVYHVLQRYGAYAAMRRFTDVFDASGGFVGPLPPREPLP
jgi:hypothetical protein